MDSAYPYEMVILLKPGSRYIEEKVSADSFRKAFFSVLTKHKDLRGKIVLIYCRKPKSGDLKYMGKYDGESTFFSGEKYILELSDGTSYFYTDDGFKPRFDY